MKLLSQTALRGLLVAQAGFAALASAGESEFDTLQTNVWNQAHAM
jgi:hypothetical protein